MKVNVKVVVAICMIGLITEGHAQLHCYVCENCADGNELPDTLLKSCSGEETTTASTAATANVTASIPFTPSTAPPSVETSTASTIETSTEPTESSTEPTTESTEPSVEPSTESTEPSVEPSTEESSIISTITAPGAPISTTSLVPGTESTLTTADITTPSIPTLILSTTVQPPVTPPFRQPSGKQSGYNCFVIRNEVNGTQKVSRGCVVASPNFNEMCLKANGNTSPLDCRICATDKCNSASGAIVSVFLLLCSIFTILSL